MEYHMGIDIGGTNIRILAAWEDMRPLGEFWGEGCTFNTSGYEVSRERYQKAVNLFLEKYGLRPEDCSGLCAAVSGVDTEKEKEDCSGIFQELGFSPEIVSVHNDCEIFLTLADPPAMILTAGTGSILFGSKRNGERIRCGGWGHILSDEGSAMDMGKRVLRAIGDHMDGRRECPRLYSLFMEMSDIRSVNELDGYLCENIMNKPAIAGFAQLAEKAAAQGDPCGAEILEDCAQALFSLADDGRRRMAAAGSAPTTLFFWGSVLTKNQTVAKGVKDRLKRVCPELKIEYPSVSAAKAALIWAGRKGRL